MHVFLTFGSNGEGNIFCVGVRVDSQLFGKKTIKLKIITLYVLSCMFYIKITEIKYDS
jgi:hypothetical protein